MAIIAIRESYDANFMKRTIYSLMNISSNTGSISNKELFSAIFSRPPHTKY